MVRLLVWMSIPLLGLLFWMWILIGLLDLIGLFPNSPPPSLIAPSTPDRILLRP